jgi:predicted ferric reductase
LYPIKYEDKKMNQIIFFLFYIFSPAIPSVLFFAKMGGGVDEYTVSIVLGIYAYVLLCNQLILASRPKFAVKILGLKGLLALHSSAPIFILSIAVVHRILKAKSGFDLDSTQAIIGAAALAVFFLASIAALLLMANIKPPLGNKLRLLRAWVEKKFKLGYKASRAFHAITVLALVALSVHVSLASTASIAANPFGIAWLGAWFILSLGVFIRYRIQGRPSPKMERKTPDANTP